MRPEHENPPEIFYNETEALKYTKNTRIQEIQAEMAERAIELLGLPDGVVGYILDIGCGSGLSGEILEEHGHLWVGCDISSAMLGMIVPITMIYLTIGVDIARDREVEGDLLLHDAGHGFGFRPGTFDGAISISCLQWLCNADYKCNNPRRRLLQFFSTLYGSLKNGAKAVFQFYPENDAQIELITSTALLSGFNGGITIDFPESTKKKKYFLCLSAGGNYDLPKGLSSVGNDDGIEETVEFTGRSRDFHRSKREKRQRKGVKDRDWVQKKKEARRKRGLHTANDSKYTARNRGPRF